MQDPQNPDSHTGIATRTKVGFGLTAAWMLAIVLITGNDVAHPLFDYIFSVPIAVWIAVLLIERLFKIWQVKSGQAKGGRGRKE